VDDATITRSGAETPLLRQAGRALAAISAWRTAAALAASFGAFSVLVLCLVVAVAAPDSMAIVVAAGAAAVPFAFALVAMRRASANAARAGAAVEGAWTEVAAEIARARNGEIDGRALAKLTRIDEAAADHILSRMSAKSLLTSSVTNEGEVRYRLLGEPARPDGKTSSPEGTKPSG
jgi:hypothetical protein